LTKGTQGKTGWARAIVPVLAFLLLSGPGDVQSGEKQRHHFDWMIEVTYPGGKTKKHPLSKNADQIHIESTNWQCFLQATEFERRGGTLKESKNVLCLWQTKDIDKRPWLFMEASCSTNKPGGDEAHLIFGEGTDRKNQHKITISCSPKRK
jgi:hypothetical protein